MDFKSMFISGIILIIIDSTYLSIISNYFSTLLLKIQNKPMKIRLLGAVICYILLVLGLNYFIISKKGSLLSAFLLGILIYGVYESTNYAIFTDWELFPLIVDSLWGGILFYATTGLTYLLV